MFFFLFVIKLEHKKDKTLRHLCILVCIHKATEVEKITHTCITIKKKKNPTYCISNKRNLFGFAKSLFLFSSGPFFIIFVPFLRPVREERSWPEYKMIHSFFYPPTSIDCRGGRPAIDQGRFEPCRTTLVTKDILVLWADHIFSIIRFPTPNPVLDQKLCLHIFAISLKFPPDDKKKLSCWSLFIVSYSYSPFQIKKEYGLVLMTTKIEGRSFQKKVVSLFSCSLVSLKEGGINIGHHA